MTRDLVNSQGERVVLSLAAALIWIICGAALAPAQSPSLAALAQPPGQGKPTTAGTQAVQKSVPVLTGISPNSAPPGGMGEIVLTGKNFVPGMYLLCGRSHDRLAWVDKFKVESPERAVGQIQVDLGAPEGVCLPLDLYYPRAETLPSRAATPEAQIVKSVSFTISNSSPMPASLGKQILIPEDEIKLGEGHWTWSTYGELRLQQGSISFLEGKAVFTEPLSALKEIGLEPALPGEKASKVFHLAFADGKKYFSPDSRETAEEAVSRLKKRLGK